MPEASGEMDDKESILIVDDDKSTLRTLSLIFEKKGYKIETASTGQEAIEKARGKFFELALMDIRLPDGEGTELLAPLKRMHPDTMVVMVTGYASLESAVRALNEGATAYITKPFNMDHVLATVREVLEKQRLIREKRRAEEELRKSYDKLQRGLEGTVHTVAKIAETRDPYTARHQKRVTSLACAIAKEMGLSEDQIEGIHVAGTLHDIGKIYVPAEILSKPGKVIDMEMNLIKTHPQVGYEILKEIEFPWPVAQIVLQHHERMDGSGYPQGLPGEDIVLEARILAVADVVEAMCSHRPFRPAIGSDIALKEVAEKSGILYDPRVVEACIRVFANNGFTFEEIPD